MKLILNITPDRVSIGKQPLSKDLYEQIALHSKVIDNSKPGQLTVDLKTFMLPTHVVFKIWNLISR